MNDANEKPETVSDGNDDNNGSNVGNNNINNNINNNNNNNMEKNSFVLLSDDNNNNNNNNNNLYELNLSNVEENPENKKEDNSIISDNMNIKSIKSFEEKSGSQMNNKKIKQEDNTENNDKVNNINDNSEKIKKKVRYPKVITDTESEDFENKNDNISYNEISSEKTDIEEKKENKRKFRNAKSTKKMVNKSKLEVKKSITVIKEPKRKKLYEE